MIKLTTKTLLLFVFSFLIGCGSNGVKQTTYTVAQDSTPSNVAKIINNSFDTRVIAVDTKRVPHPTFGTPFNTFITAPGQIRLAIKYRDSEKHLTGNTVIFANVEAGKEYALFDDIIGRRISYFLRDVNSNEVIRAPFLSTGLAPRTVQLFGKSSNR